MVSGSGGKAERWERIRHIVAAQSKARKNSARDNPDALLTTSEATKLLNIRANTIRYWSNKGMLETYPIGARGDRRFRHN